MQGRKSRHSSFVFSRSSPFFRFYPLTKDERLTTKEVYYEAKAESSQQNSTFSIQ